MEFIAIKIVKTLALPPGLFLLMMLVGLLLRSRKCLLSTLLLWSAFAGLYLFSTPWLVFQLAEQVEYRPALVDIQPYVGSSDTAIVVLGSGRYPDAPEFSGVDALSSFGLQRVRYAAWLHAQTALPVLTTGGRPYQEKESEAEIMARHLTDFYDVQPVWLESESRNTLDHGRLVADVLAPHNITRILLVTHAAHMRRSLAAFANSSLQVVAAPTVYSMRHPLDKGVLLFRPSAGALKTNSFYVHELLGDLWYRLRHGDQYGKSQL